MEEKVKKALIEGLRKNYQISEDRADAILWTHRGAIAEITALVEAERLAATEAAKQETQKVLFVNEKTNDPAILLDMAREKIEEAPVFTSAHTSAALYAELAKHFLLMGDDLAECCANQKSSSE